jgi:hypothetical protein
VSDYYPFGSLLPGRNYSSDGYRFGFNTQEKDDEIYGSNGTSYYAEFWQYESRAGRRWNLDPVDQVSISNYAALGLNPMMNVDPKGNSKDWFVNQETGEVIHLPGVKDITKYNGPLEGKIEDYKKFATDEEMANEKTKYWAIKNQHPGPDFSNESYSAFRIPANKVNDYFKKWGVYSTRYQLVTNQTYRYQDVISVDHDYSGRIQTTSRLRCWVVSIEYDVAHPANPPHGEFTNSFNEDNDPRMISYERHFMFTIETYEDVFQSIAINGLPQPLPDAPTPSNDAGVNLFVDFVVNMMELIFRK